MRTQACRFPGDLRITSQARSRVFSACSSAESIPCSPVDIGPAANLPVRLPVSASCRSTICLWRLWLPPCRAVPRAPVATAWPSAFWFKTWSPADTPCGGRRDRAPQRIRVWASRVRGRLRASRSVSWRRGLRMRSAACPAQGAVGRPYIGKAEIRPEPLLTPYVCRM